MSFGIAVAVFYVCLHQACSDLNGKKFVQVEQGTLEGIISVTDTGMKIATFTSIPYAKPPVGPLRFKSPQPPEKWDGVRPADMPFKSCPQAGEGEEDCLLLNIVAPLEVGEKLPVMVWIHGGGFFFGSASPLLYGLENFVNHGVVMVSINYRLSVLGFLSVNGSDVTPNAGLKDQVAALRWVHKNIATFGGDPSKVTIFGESAGAVSVQYLILSPMAKGLFSAAIMQSGSACNNWAFRQPNSRDAFFLGEMLGKNTSSPQELVDFLRSLPAHSLVDKVLDQWEKDSEGRNLRSVNLLNVPFRPTVEYPVPEGESFEEVFLSDRPDSLLKQGLFNKVPTIIGMNSLEAALFTEVPATDEWQTLESNWEAFVPVDMGLPAASPASKYVAAKVRDFYFNNQTLSDLSTQAFLECSSDADWTRRLSECSKHMARYLPGELWVYYFTYRGDNTLVCSIKDCSRFSGAAHFDECPLMFSDNLLAQELTEADRIVQGHLLKMWTSFAAERRPDTGTQVSWTPVEGDVLSHLLIDIDLRMEPGDLRENYTSFWTRVGMEAARLQ